MPRMPKPKKPRIVPHGLDGSAVQKFTKNELKTYLKGQKIKGYSNKSKPDLVQIYLNHQKNIEKYGGANIPKSELDYTRSAVARRGGKEVKEAEVKQTEEPDVKQVEPVAETEAEQNKSLNDYFENIINNAEEKVAEVARDLQLNPENIKNIRQSLKDAIGKEIPEETTYKNIRITRQYVENLQNGDRVVFHEVESKQGESVESLLESKNPFAEEESANLEALYQSRAGSELLNEDAVNAINQLLFRATSSAQQFLFNVGSQTLWALSNQDLANFRIPILNHLESRYNIPANRIAYAAQQINRLVEFRRNSQSSFELSPNLQRFYDRWGTQQTDPLEDPDIIDIPQVHTRAEEPLSEYGIDPQVIAGSGRAPPVSMGDLGRMTFNNFMEEIRRTRAELTPDVTLPTQTIVGTPPVSNTVFDMAEGFLVNFFNGLAVLGVGYGSYLLLTGQDDEFLATFVGTGHQYFTSEEFSSLKSSSDLFELNTLINQINDDTITMEGWKNINGILRNEYRMRDNKSPTLARMSPRQYNELRDACEDWFDRNQDPVLTERIRQAQLIGVPITDPIQFVLNDALHPKANTQTREEAMTSKEFLKWVSDRSKKDPQLNVDDPNLVDAYLAEKLQRDILLSKPFGEWLEEPEQKKITVGTFTPEQLYKSYLDSVLTTDQYREYLVEESKTDPGQSVAYYRNEYLKSTITQPQPETEDEIQAERVYIEEQKTTFRRKEKRDETSGLGSGLKQHDLDTALGSDAKPDIFPEPLRPMVQRIIVRGERQDPTALIDRHRIEYPKQLSRHNMIAKCETIHAEVGILLYLPKIDYNKLDTKTLILYYEVICVSYESLMRQLGHRQHEGKNGMIRNIIVDVSSLGLTLSDLANGSVSVSTTDSASYNRGRSLSKKTPHQSSTHITAKQGHSEDDYRYIADEHQIKRKLDNSFTSLSGDLIHRPPHPRDLQAFNDNLFFRKRPKLTVESKKQLKNLLM